MLTRAIPIGFSLELPPLESYRMLKEIPYWVLNCLTCTRYKRLKSLPVKELTGNKNTDVSGSLSC